jgi:hypothetical protein
MPETTNLERDIKIGEICLIVINGLLLVTSIIIAWIYYGQLQEMRKATEATERAAKAAQESVNLTRQEIVNAQAAILAFQFRVEFPFQPPRGLISSIWPSSGSAMATRVHQEFTVYWVTRPQLKTTKEEHFVIDIPQLRGGTADGLRGVNLTGLDQDTWEKLFRQENSRQTLKIVGTLRYENGFNPVPDQPFCRIYYFHPPLTNMNSDGFLDCSDYESTIAQFAWQEKRDAESKKP